MKQKEVLFITGNKSKLAETTKMAERFSVKIVGQKANLFEPMVSDSTKILIDKAKDAYKKFGKPLIVDDAGIYFGAYPNFPGVFTKFIIKLLGFNGIIKLLEGKSKDAYFKCTIGFIDEKLDQPLLFEGISKGKITEKISINFNGNFEFNSIFIPEGESKTFSEMSIEERSKHCHRDRALEKFLSWYVKEY
ncbi:MAG: non-canonical purine NTP pyrophosphatase [Candidatus Nealsonbacteria bacterium]